MSPIVQEERSQVEMVVLEKTYRRLSKKRFTADRFLNLELIDFFWMCQYSLIAGFSEPGIVFSYRQSECAC
jgi:hypothetical protein